MFFAANLGAFLWAGSPPAFAKATASKEEIWKAFRQKTSRKPDRNALPAFAKAMPGEEEKQMLLMPGYILRR